MSHDHDSPDPPNSMIQLTNPETLEPWQMVTSTIWLKLGRRFFQMSADQVSIRDFGRECEMLAAVAAWFQHRGNITHAATFLGTGRRSLRVRLERWVALYPHLVPEEMTRSTLSKFRGPEGGRSRRLKRSTALTASNSSSTTTPASPITSPREPEGVSEHREGPR